MNFFLSVDYGFQKFYDIQPVKEAADLFSSGLKQADEVEEKQQDDNRNDKTDQKSYDREEP